MYQVGLTGGIASGKSSVSKILQNFGAYIIDADQISRTLTMPGQKVWQEVITAFGDDIVASDEQIDRHKLASIIFSDQLKRQRLEAITHPAIWSEVACQIESAKKLGNKIVVLDVPLLIETGWHHKVNCVWVVYATPLVQQERLMLRDSIDYQQAQLRINAQLSLESKKQVADVVIDNSGDYQQTLAQVSWHWRKLIIDIDA